MIEEFINHILRSESAINSITTRIRPVGASQKDAKPYITYRVIDGEDFDTLDEVAEWHREVVQIDVYADTYGQAEQLARKVKNTLHYYHETLDLGTEGGTEIAVLQQSPFTDLSAPPEDGKEKPVYRLSSDFRCTFRTIE